jgi:hypothetical protein
MRACVVALLLGSGCVVGVGGAPGSVEEDPPVEQVPQPTTPVASSIAGGTFAPLGTYTGVAGRALMVRKLDGQTELSIALTGVTADTAYTAHLHAAPCPYGGGGHYKINPAVVDVQETNELWVAGTSSTTGALYGAATFPHLARGEALSIVVHDPLAAGAKMACADLSEADAPLIEWQSTIRPFADATTTDMTIGGTVTARRTATGTSYTLDLTGLDPAAVGYDSHVHAEPCDVTTGGGHYKIDPLVMTAIDTNELWLPVTGYAAGTAATRKDSPHLARTDAQSIVLHRVISDTVKPKVACADLTRMTTHYALESGGAVNVLAPDTAMTGSARMMRKLNGVTEVSLVITGLVADAKYTAHVHNQVCAADKGGSHFKFDTAVVEALEGNEMWFAMTAGADGSAHDSMWVPKIAGAAAASLVVHSEDGMRVACFDLQ